MLPDYPHAKALLQKHYKERFQQVKAKALGPVMNLPMAPLHEGHRVVVIREDGSKDEMRWQHVRSSIDIPKKALKGMGYQQVLENLDRLAIDQAHQQKRKAYEAIDKVVEKTGNKIETGPPSAEGLLEAYEKLDGGVDRNGNFLSPIMVCSPESAALWEAAHDDLHEKPEFLIRQKELEIMKREAWREREGSRKLVG